MTTLAELAARRKPAPKSYVVQVWDPVRIVWVVESLERFRDVNVAADAAKRRVERNGALRVVELPGNRVVAEFGVK